MENLLSKENKMNEKLESFLDNEREWFFQNSLSAKVRLRAERLCDIIEQFATELSYVTSAAFPHGAGLVAANERINAIIKECLIESKKG